MPHKAQPLLLKVDLDREFWPVVAHATEEDAFRRMQEAEDDTEAHTSVAGDRLLLVHVACQAVADFDSTDGAEPMARRWINNSRCGVQ